MKLASRKKKAIKFESALNKFAMRVIRGTFNPFKICNHVAQDRKKYCIRKLVIKSMGENQKKFIQWRNVTR
jgi:N-glycosylase/DNA lyase